VFGRLLAGPHQRVVVSTRSLDWRLEQSHKLSVEAFQRARTGRPASPRPALPVPFAEPSSDLERRIAGIWSEILGIEPVGVRDNFFELGGHSLLATQIMARVSEDLRVDLPMQRLFDGPTVAEFATCAAQALAQRAGGDRLSRMLAEIQGLSEEELAARLASAKKGQRG
jgi:acyl carrier protein